MAEELPYDSVLSDLNLTLTFHTDAFAVGDVTTSAALKQPKNYSLLYRAVAVTLSSIIFTVGFVGNLLVVVIIIRTRSMHTTTNCYLMSLALADCLVLLAATLPAVPETFFKVDEWPFGRALCSILIYVQYVGVDASSLSIAAFTVERYIAICHPIRAQTVCTVSRAKRIIAGLWIFTLVYCGPWLGLTELKTHPLADGSLYTECYFRLERSAYLALYMFDLIVFYLLPFVISTALYCLIGRILILTSLQHAREQPRRSAVDRKRSQDKGKNSDKSSKRRSDSRVQVIRMLVVVVLVFATLWLPYRVIVVYNSFAKQKYVDQWFLMFSRTLIYINCAINPILYNVMSVKFRRAFKNHLCCGLRQAGAPTFLYSEMATETHGKRNPFQTTRRLSASPPQTKDTSTCLLRMDVTAPHQQQELQVQGHADHPLKVILLEWVKGRDVIKLQTLNQRKGTKCRVLVPESDMTVEEYGKLATPVENGDVKNLAPPTSAEKAGSQDKSLATDTFC